MTFIHLHRHSEYSALDGMGTADQYAAKAVKLNQFALALTDHGNLCGSLEHIAACEKNGLHPIVGMEAYFRPDRANHDKDQKRAKSPYHMILFADGLAGWRSLMRLSSEAYTEESYYYKPCIDYALLEEESEGIICSTACVSSYLADCLLNDDSEAARIHVQKLQEIFKDKLYIEIMPHDFDEQRKLNPLLIETAIKCGIPYIATADAHYVDQTDWDTASCVFKMNTNDTISKAAKKKEAGEEVYGECPTLYLMGEDQIRDLFLQNHPEIAGRVDTAISNTGDLASRIAPFALNKSLKLPRIKAKKTAEQILREWCDEGLKRIGETENPIYLERMEYELGVLKDKDVLDYFVIIGEHVRWAKDEGIRVAPGRGSAAGCLVSYLIKITSVDPIAYGLLFERFLNPERKGMPDIDIDLPSDKVEYVKQKFFERHGIEHVSNVISFQTFKAKGALQGVSRVYEIPIGDVLHATKQIDDDMDLSEALATSAAVQIFAKAHPEVIKHALKLEGMIKTFSKHASAVVFTEKPVTEYMPTMRARKDSPVVTAFSDKPSSPIISEYGILKVDFLSTTDLSVQQAALDMIEKRHGKKLDLDELPIMRNPQAVDAATMKLFQSGHTFGLFQFGGAGITGMLRKMNPQSVLDLAACNALYRPGPLDGGVADDYLNRIDNPALIEYWHPAVEPFLKHTNGIMIFQEQLMQVVVAIGDFSPGESDDMRKATGKLYRLGKDEAKAFMQQYHAQWHKGTKAHGIAPEESEEIWQKILAFGGYSFNASHSVCYSAEAYQDAYLKANYPEEYYAALMAKDQDKAPQAVREALARGIKILPPDVNKSEAQMTLTDDGILCGLLSILGVGDVAASEILEKRPFSSFGDFIEKVNKRRCNATVQKALLESGAFDFDPEIDKSTPEQMLHRLKFDVSDSKFTDKIRNLYNETVYLGLATPGESITIGGEIIEIKEQFDRKGKKMCWVTVAYGAETWTVVVFASMYPQYESLIQKGELILARVRVDERGGNILSYMVSPTEYMKMKEAEELASVG